MKRLNDTDDIQLLEMGSCLILTEASGRTTF